MLLHLKTFAIEISSKMLFHLIIIDFKSQTARVADMTPGAKLIQMSSIPFYISDYHNIK